MRNWLAFHCGYRLLYLPSFTANNKIGQKGFGALSWIQATGGSRPRVTVYFWGGTCAKTKKQSKFIDIRGKSGGIIPAFIKNLHRAKDFVSSHNCRIKFIGVPFYLVSLYNDIKGHLNPTVFLNSDKEVEFQVDLLNKHIEEINTQLDRNTLNFNADLRDTRRGKKRHYFELLADGVHSSHLIYSPKSGCGDWNWISLESSIYLPIL